MRPRKDYDDYTKFINDTFAGEKEGMLSETVNHMNKTGGFLETETLKTKSEQDLSLMNRFKTDRVIHGRSYSTCGQTLAATEK